LTSDFFFGMLFNEVVEMAFLFGRPKGSGQRVLTEKPFTTSTLFGAFFIGGDTPMRKKQRGRKEKVMTADEFRSGLSYLFDTDEGGETETQVDKLSAAEKRYRKECGRDLFDDMAEDLEAEIEGWEAAAKEAPHGKLFKGREIIGRGL
jgi:hypothetical protein